MDGLPRMKKSWTFIQTIRIYCQVIDVEFGIERCVMLIVKRKGERKKMKCRIWNASETRRKRKSQTPGSIRNGYYQTEMKEKLRMVYLRRMWKFLIKGMNTWSFLKSTREDLRQMEQKSKKLITMLKVLHPWNSIRQAKEDEDSKVLCYNSRTRRISKK